MRIAFEAAFAGLLYLHFAQLIVVFGLNVQIHHHPAVAVAWEGVTLKTCPIGGCGFHKDVGIGKANLIISQWGFFRGLVDARAIAFIGAKLVAYLHFEFAIGGHHAQAAHSPLMNVAKATYCLKSRLIACLPTHILIVGAQLHHTEWHPRTRSNHPARVCCAYAGVYIVGEGLKALRSAFHCALL